MNFAAEYQMDPNDQTQCAGLSLIEENNHPAIEYLVAVRQSRQLVKVFRPMEKNITFGRSSRCSITLPDPRFSRKAGEIVLGPVPILRRYQDGEENSEMIPIVPGKPYRLRPYTLTLIESGDVIFNRNKKQMGSKTRAIRSMFLILLALGTGSIFFLHQGMTDMVSKGQQEIAAVSFADKPVQKETLKSAASKPVTEKQEVISNKPSANPAPVPSAKKRAVPAARQKVENSRMRAAIREEELDKVIKSAALLIEQGNLKMAGRTLSPLLPHVDVEHRAVIIEVLDPPNQTLFQKAYMLKPYEPEKSKEILLNIVESGLKILPSYGKAMKVLKDEQGTLISIQ
jgi:hypothetical protein